MEEQKTHITQQQVISSGSMACDMDEHMPCVPKRVAEQNIWERERGRVLFSLHFSYGEREKNTTNERKKVLGLSGKAIKI